MSSTNLLYLLVRVTLILCVIHNAKGKPPNKIVAGEETSIEKFPSTVSIRVNGQQYCGGSLITNKHVLTAAHCTVIQSVNSTVYDRKRAPGSFSIVIGTTNSSDLRFTCKVKEVHVHEGYIGRTVLKNDIAILTLDELVISTDVSKPITLPSSNVDSGAQGYIVGWGYTSWNGPVSQILKQAQVTVYDNDACGKRLGESISDTQLCAVHPDNGFCNGDSGGPLIVNGEIVGIISASVFCSWGLPQIYTRVYSYVDWIRNIINSDQAKL